MLLRPLSFILFHFSHLLLCSSSGCGERWRLGKEVGRGEEKGCLDALVIYSLLLQPEEGKGREPSWLQKLEKLTCSSLPGAVCQALPEATGEHTYLPRPSSMVW